MLAEGLNVLSVQQHASGIRGVHASENVEERGLAGAARAYYDAELSFVYPKGHLIESRDLLIAVSVEFTYFVKGNI